MKAPETLAELVETALRYRDLPSVRRLAQLAQDHDLAVTYTTLNQMRSSTYKFRPKADTVRALAWLAGVSERVAFTAAGQPVPGPPLADELPDGADHLSAKSRKIVVEMVRVLVDLEGHHDDQQQHTDPDPAASAGGADAGGEGVGAAQTGPSAAALDPTLPDDLDLAAHPHMPIERDRWDAVFDQAGEENQDQQEGDA